MKKLEKIVDSLYCLTPGLKNEKYDALIKFLRQRIYNPDAYVVLLGESCCGKSTLLNSMLGSALLPVSAAPLTATVTEILLEKDSADIGYVAITKTAKAKRLTEEQFRILAVENNPEIARLRVSVPVGDKLMDGVRFFDTPGYDSLVAEHEEVLLDFLPNADAIIYMVNYRTGIQNSDYNFLKELLGLIRKGIPISLVINRVPINVSPNDRRIIEIKDYVYSILGKENMPCYLIPTGELENGVVNIPEIKEFFSLIKDEVNSFEHKAELYNAFVIYIQEYIDMLSNDLEKQLALKHMSIESIQNINSETEALIEKLKLAEAEMVIPTFDKIISNIDILFAKEKQSVYNSLTESIDAESRLEMNEMIGHCESYLLPHYIHGATENIQHYIEVEITDLNDRLDNYINEAVMEFEAKVTFEFNHIGQDAVGTLIKKLAKKALYTNLVDYFVAYSAGKSIKVGVVNAASHILKKAGNLFGKTFSRETHNALKHFLAKMGLNTSKAVGNIAAVVVEMISIGIDYASWKYFLKKSINKGLQEWESNQKNAVKTDLVKLKNTNIEELRKIAENFKQSLCFNSDLQQDEAKLADLLSKIHDIEKELKNAKRN